MQTACDVTRYIVSCSALLPCAGNSAEFGMRFEEATIRNRIFGK